MKKIFLPLSIFAILVLLYLFYSRGYGIYSHPSGPQKVEQDGKTRTFAWSIKKDMPTPRTEVSAAVLDEKIYVIGGLSGFGKTLRTVEVYDPRTDSWTRAPDLPEGRHHAGAISWERKLYVVGGFSGIGFRPAADVFEFDPAMEKWVKKSLLPSPRGAMGIAVDAGKIFIVGGVEPEGLSNELAIYDIRRDEWNDAEPAPTKRDHLAAGFMGGKLLVAGGRARSLTRNLATLEIYDPHTNSWEKGPDMPTPRGGIAGAVFESLFFVAGGERPASTFAEVEAFDPEKNSWISMPPLPTPRHGLSAAVVGRTIYVIGGGKRPTLSISGANEALEIQ